MKNNEAETYFSGDRAVYQEEDMLILVRVVENNSTQENNIFSLEVIQTMAPRGSTNDQETDGVLPPMRPGRILHVQKPRIDNDIWDTWRLLPSFTYGV